MRDAILTGIFLAFVLPCATVAAEDNSLSGEWYFDVLTSPNGPGRREVLFLQEEERVIGFIDGNSASGRFVGSVDGENLEFTAVTAAFASSRGNDHA